MYSQRVQLKERKVRIETQCFRDMDYYLLGAYLVPGMVVATLQIFSYFILTGDFTIRVVEMRKLKQTPSDVWKVTHLGKVTETNFSEPLLRRSTPASGACVVGIWKLVLGSYFSREATEA